MATSADTASGATTMHPTRCAPTSAANTITGRATIVTTIAITTGGRSITTMTGIAMTIHGGVIGTVTTAGETGRGPQPLLPVAAARARLRMMIVSASPSPA